jgi:hypothetical protein
MWCWNAVRLRIRGALNAGNSMRAGEAQAGQGRFGSTGPSVTLLSPLVPAPVGYPALARAARNEFLRGRAGAPARSRYSCCKSASGEGRRGGNWQHQFNTQSASVIAFELRATLQYFERAIELDAGFAM